MIFKNIVRYEEYDHALFDVVAEVVDCLPNNNYKIKIETKEIPEEELRNGDFCEIVENEYEFVVPYDEAACIMEMPEKFYEYFIDDEYIWCLCRIHKYGDHREIDVYEIPSFRYMYKFLKIASNPGNGCMEKRGIEGNINYYHSKDHFVFEECTHLCIDEESISDIIYRTNIGIREEYTSNVRFDAITSSQSSKIDFLGLNLPITRYDFHYNGETIDIFDYDGIEKDGFCAFKNYKKEK